MALKKYRMWIIVGLIALAIIIGSFYIKTNSGNFTGMEWVDVKNIPYEKKIKELLKDIEDKKKQNIEFQKEKEGYKSEFEKKNTENIKLLENLQNLREKYRDILEKKTPTVYEVKSSTSSLFLGYELELDNLNSQIALKDKTIKVQELQLVNCEKRFLDSQGVVSARENEIGNFKTSLVNMEKRLKFEKKSKWYFVGVAVILTGFISWKIFHK